MKKQVLLFVLILSLLLNQFLFANDIKIEDKEFNENNDELFYEVKAKYPVIKGMKNEDAQEKINDFVELFIMKKIKDFKYDMISWDSTRPPEINYPSSFGYTYNIKNLSNNVYSICIYNFSYYSGAAHPNSYKTSMNFDLTSGDYINFSVLFRQESDYLQYISDYCIFDLKRQGRETDFGFEDDWLNRGAGPVEDNFKNFNITEKGLLIIFNNYQVGPYVIGSPEVNIPYEKITNIVKLDGILKPFLN
jgi:hypothetical protein